MLNSSGVFLHGSQNADHLPRQCASRKAMAAAGMIQLVMRLIVKRKDSLLSESFFATIGRTIPPSTPRVTPTQAFSILHQKLPIPKNPGTEFMAWCTASIDERRIARRRAHKWSSGVLVRLCLVTEHLPGVRQSNFWEDKQS